MKAVNVKSLASDFDGYNYIFIDVLFQRYIRYLGKGIKEDLSGLKIKELIAEDSEMFNNYIAKLFEIIRKNQIRIEPLKIEEVISVGAISPMFNMILTYLSKFRKGDIFYMNVGNDDVLLFNLLKSIYRANPNLLTDVRYTNEIDFKSIDEFIYLDKNEYKTMCKALRNINLDNPSNPRNSNNINKANPTDYYEMYMKHILDSLKIIILENHVYGEGMLLYSKKLFTSKMVFLTIYCFGKSLEIFTGQEHNNENMSNSANKYACFIVSEICKAMHFRIYGKYTNGNILQSYDDYVEKFMHRNQHLWDSNMSGVFNDLDSSTEDIEECRELRKKIKEVKNNLYILRKANEMESKLADDEYADNDLIEISEEPAIIETEEHLPSRQDKINKLKDNNVVVYGNTELFKGYLDELEIKDTNRFKGKTIDEKYKYVVKLTKGIDHAIGYDLNSEIDKTGAKLITCSRTNIDLILDSILNQIEEC